VLFFDLDLNNAPSVRGVPCLLGVPLQQAPYQGFVGTLAFVSEPGVEGDPTWEQLGSGFQLLYFPADGSATQQVPLQATPAQLLSVVLGGQNCTVSVYERDISDALFSAVYITAPASVPIGVTETATASGGSTWLWSITNGVILSGQGTSSITFKATAPGAAVLGLAVTFTDGSSASTSLAVQAYDPAAYAISAPLYVFAGQFGVAVSVPGGGIPIEWSVSGTGIRLVGSASAAATAVDFGQSGTSATISLSVGGVPTSTWTFVIIPYTSTISYTSPSVAPAPDNTSGYVDFTLDLGWQATILSMQTTTPALLRLYVTAAARAADDGRRRRTERPRTAAAGAGRRATSTHRRR